jgi:hypothetical protein
MFAHLGGWSNGHRRGALGLRSARWPLLMPGVAIGKLGWRQPASPE